MKRQELSGRSENTQNKINYILFTSHALNMKAEIGLK